MLVESIKCKLKDDTEVVIRNVMESDVQETISISLDIANTSDYMMKYPEEVNTDAEKELENIMETLDAEKMCIVGCFSEKKLLGYAGVFPVGKRIRIAHRCALGLGVRSSARGLGVGSVLLNRIIQIAKECGYEQMELDVVSENVYGIKLYENAGFTKTGMIPNAFKMKNGNVYDFNIMVLNLKNS